MDQTIRLDAKKRESAFYEENIYPLRRGERNNVVLTVQVRADGAPYDLTGKEARLVGTTADGKLVGPCALDVSDAKAGTGSLTLPASMCSAVGTAHAYIEIREGDTLVETTDSFACKVLECADMDAEQAAETAPLVVELQDAVAEAKRAAEGADAAASHQPRIGGSGTWEVWDAVAGAYVDTGVAAQGPKGDAGDKGDAGAPGKDGSDAAATDVQIDGTSITSNGVANVPKAGGGELGVVRVDRNGKNGISLGADGEAKLNPASDALITARSGSRPITASNFDSAVQAALCDGKGAAWTAAEQAAAKKRMGIDESSGSSGETAQIWVYDFDLSPDIDDGRYTFHEIGLTSVYPMAFTSEPTYDDIIFHKGYLYYEILDADSRSIICRSRNRLI